MWGRRTTGNCRPYYYYCFFEANLCFISKFILSLYFSQNTPLHHSAAIGELEVTRLLVESKADVAAENKCFNPPPSHHLSLTICLAAVATLHSNAPSTRTKPTSLHTCAASARPNDALSRAAAVATLHSKRPPANATLLHISARSAPYSCPRAAPSATSSDTRTSARSFLPSHRSRPPLT
jgi:hypothetical protein